MKKKVKNRKKEDVEKEIKIIDVNIDLLTLDHDHHINMSTTLIVLGLTLFIAAFIVPEGFWVVFAFLFILTLALSALQVRLRNKVSKKIDSLHNKKLKLLK